MTRPHQRPPVAVLLAEAQREAAALSRALDRLHRALTVQEEEGQDLALARCHGEIAAILARTDRQTSRTLTALFPEWAEGCPNA